MFTNPLTKNFSSKKVIFDMFHNGHPCNLYNTYFPEQSSLDPSPVKSKPGAQTFFEQVPILLRVVSEVWSD